MFKKIFILMLIGISIFGLTAPRAAVAADSTIVEIAIADDRFDTLVAAVVAAGLDDELSAGEWTVFAPTDDAFAKLGLNANNIASQFTKSELVDILLYHVIPAEIFSDKAKTLVGDVTMGNGNIAGLKVFEGDIYINDDSKVILADVNASNGVIHAVDTVILGPWPRVEGQSMVETTMSTASTGTIVDIAVGDDRFETLVAAVVAAGLADALSAGEWTVFAPTDDAFAKLGLNANNIASTFSEKELVDILLYHVIPDEISSAEAKTLVGDVTMGNGSIAGLKVFQDDIYINDDSKVIVADVNASNGVIHAVDTVILGPWPK